MAGLSVYCARTFPLAATVLAYFASVSLSPGQIYIDLKAPRELRISAQGFIALVTLVNGAVIGSYLQGVTVGANEAAELVSGYDWKSIWLIPTAAAGVVMTLPRYRSSLYETIGVRSDDSINNSYRTRQPQERTVFQERRSP